MCSLVENLCSEALALIFVRKYKVVSLGSTAVNRLNTINSFIFFPTWLNNLVVLLLCYYTSTDLELLSYLRVIKVIISLGIASLILELSSLNLVTLF